MTATNKAYQNARRLRRHLSLPETLLWQRLRGAPVRFRRQHPLGPYVLDFYCPAAKLAIEVDGAVHDMGDRPERDEIRSSFLLERGVEVLRIAAKEVLGDPDDVAESLIRHCLARAEPLHRSPPANGPPPHGSAAGRND